ncbi:sorting nexin-4 [Kwoniella dejecticola CBS 10117]|uniref:Sorting nexin-4 n=1 Tax=Kwoniella dejecticola CBS 10117 TaxID=1296121 RepID=A0A1A6A9Z8_9TREE|nr:sorting nexin-4 [Kwoniella dejecticola CBS 10117]OBR86879.1 sorting nexin-4 [Kwoniella dejecticola CBS 10117]
MSSNPIDEDGFHSIAWDDAPPRTAISPHSPFDEDVGEGFETISSTSATHDEVNASASTSTATPSAAGLGARREGQQSVEADAAEWNGRWMSIEVREPLKEHEGSKDMYVSYAVKTQTNLPTFPHTVIVTRRRFQDFVFLRDHLVRSFPACVVPPIPDKHRLEYIKGDRFGPEFIERRRLDLQRFADRIARHPTLQRSQLVNDFLQSTEWTVAKHHHISHPPPESHSSLMDSLSDTFINAFSKVRKPDGRFVEMAEELERFEEGLTSVERLVGRGKGRIDDLSTDYQDMAAAYQGLGYLESGITEPLNRFAEKMLDFSALLKHMNQSTVEPFLIQSHSLSAYTASHRNVIKLRDQKQLDFEELSAYLSAIVSERDRLAALNSGHSAAPVGLGTYLRDQVDKLRGTDDIHTRRERIRKMDGKITELQEAVTTAHETSTAFSDEVLKEHTVFELSKKEEMKEILQTYADGQVEMLQRAMDDWDRIIPLLQRIRVDV